MDQEKNEKQLFVRNLSYQTTENDITELFQTFGPLKHTSVVKDKDGVSKGFGFVKFALESDAATAMDKLQGASLHGRKLKLELGVKKERLTKKEREAASAVKTDAVVTDKKPEVKRETKKPVVKVEVKEEPVEEETEDNTGHIKKSRQILVFGVPVDISKKAFKMAMSKISKKSEVELMKEENELSTSLHIISPPGKIFLITAVSRQEAAKILAVLNKATTTVHNLEIRKYMENNKNSDETAAASGVSNKTERLVARTLADMTELEYRKRKCRLILRNLSFQAVEQNVIDRMSKFGPLVSVEIPRTIIEKSNTNRRAASKKRGRNEDEDAAENNEDEDEEGDVKSPDQIGDNQVLRPKGFGFVTFLCERDAKLAVESSAGLKVCNREVAIDFCMNKESYTKYGTAAAAEGEEQKDKEGDVEVKTEKIEVKKEKLSDDEEGTDDDEENASDADNNDDDGSDAEKSDKDDEGEETDEEEVKEKGEKKPSDDVQEGCTVFVRGLPFDAEATDIKTVMRAFGRVTMSIVVKDKATGISKGSAFVKFASPDEAQKCLAEAGTSGGCLNIKDRLCKVNLAVDRESAQKLKSEDRHGKDKRNLYLANEGLLTPKEGSAEGKDKKSAEMSDADREKRQRAQNEKRKKLQNPLFFVSGNRLSVRNLGKDVTDHELKVSCLKAVTSALARKLVSEKDLEQHIAAQGSATTVTTVIPPVNSKSCVKSAKVMLDLTRVKEGVPQSRGYGFVEFTHHAHALACLRELNNNSRYNEISTTGGGTSAEGGAKGRLIVEFSLENIQKVKVLQDREARQKKRRDDGANGTSNKKSSSDKNEKEADEQEEEQPAKKKAKTAEKTNKAEKVEKADNNKTEKAEKVEKPKKEIKTVPVVATSEETEVSAATVTKKTVDKKRKLETSPATAVEETVKQQQPSKEDNEAKKQQSKKVKQEKPAAEAAPIAKSSSSGKSSETTKASASTVAAAQSPAAATKKATTPEQEAKLAEKRARQKQRKEEFKAARKADRVAKHAVQKAEKKAKREAEGIVEEEAVSTPVKKSDGKKAKNGSGDGGEGTPQAKPWGGHKRLRAMKNKAGGGGKK